jgi:cytochrome c-type biogenesis protein CcmH
MRLVRAYVVLDQRDKAEDALSEGLQAFPASVDEGKRLLALGRELGLDGGGAKE